MRTPLNDVVSKYKGHISFHTPAHSGSIVAGEVLDRDITELSYSDNIFNPCGVIADSLSEISNAYGVENSVFITGGATTAVHTAIYSLRDKVFLIAGTCHRSVFSAVRLYNIKAYYTPNLDNLCADLAESKADVLFLTSPNYFGKTTILEKLKDVIIVTDEAHGSHFAFSGLLPESAVNFADIVVHSLHKTLPVPTGGAILHFKTEYAERVYNSLNEIHSTSPSYLMMCAMEAAVADFSENGEEYYKNVIAEVLEFKKGLNACFEPVKTNDPTRLVIASDYCGEDVSAYLETNGIFPEMSYENRVVFIVNPYNYLYLPKLLELLNNMPELPPYEKEQRSTPVIEGMRELKNYIFYETVGIDDAVGRTAYKEVGLYPPGVPFMLPGDIITKKHAVFIKKEINRMFGLDNGRVFVVKYNIT